MFYKVGWRNSMTVYPRFPCEYRCGNWILVVYILGSFLGRHQMGDSGDCDFVGCWKGLRAVFGV